MDTQSAVALDALAKVAEGADGAEHFSLPSNIAVPGATQFVLFATPSLDHKVTLDYFRSAMETSWLLREAGIAHGYTSIGGDPYLSKVRNNLASGALQDYPQMTDFFFLDDDISWPPEAALRLIQHPAEIVAGIYPKKNDLQEYPCELVLKDGKLVEKDGLFQAIAVPTGFLRIKRSALEKVAAVSGWYTDSKGRGASRHIYNIFEMGYSESEHLFWGEDFAFCRKWCQLPATSLAMAEQAKAEGNTELEARLRKISADSNGELWVDPNIPFTHRGSKRWDGTFGNIVQSFVRGLSNAAKAHPAIKVKEALIEAGLLETEMAEAAQ